MNLWITLKNLKDCAVLVKEKSQFPGQCFLMFLFLLIVMVIFQVPGVYELFRKKYFKNLFAENNILDFGLFRKYFS